MTLKFLKHKKFDMIPVGVDNERQDFCHLSGADSANPLIYDGGLAAAVLPDQHDRPTCVRQHSNQVQQLLRKARNRENVMVCVTALIT